MTGGLLMSILDHNRYSQEILAEQNYPYPPLMFRAWFELTCINNKISLENCDILMFSFQECYCSKQETGAELELSPDSGWLDLITVIGF